MTSSLLVTVRAWACIEGPTGYHVPLRVGHGYGCQWCSAKIPDDECIPLSALADALEASEKKAEESNRHHTDAVRGYKEVFAAGFAQCRAAAVQLVQDRGEIFLGEAIRALEDTP